MKKHGHKCGDVFRAKTGELLRLIYLDFDVFQMDILHPQTTEPTGKYIEGTSAKWESWSSDAELTKIDLKTYTPTGLIEQPPLKIIGDIHERIFLEEFE